MRVFFSRDLMNHDPEKRNKITGIIFEHGYDCRSCCWCPNGRKCKYRGKYTIHNLMCRISTFMRYTVGWKSFSFPFYFQRKSTDLSGTTKCPYQMPRRKDCWNCKFSAGMETCTNKIRPQLIREGRHEELDCEDRGRCALWEPCDWFEEYDHKTGELIF